MRNLRVVQICSSENNWGTLYALREDGIIFKKEPVGNWKQVQDVPDISKEEYQKMWPKAWTGNEQDITGEFDHD